jgi:sialate O-acetylesterase
MRFSFLLSALLIGALAEEALADIKLPRLVGDHMVLQRDAKVAVWGWADPGETVRVKFHGKRVAVRADSEGQWATSLGPFVTGGPYDMTISGRNQVTVHDILLGDVWLASGQSNMEMPLKGGAEWDGGIRNQDREVASARLPEIRTFLAEQKIAFSPQPDIATKDGWRAVTPQSVGSFSAVAYLFGRELHQRYHVPIGLIESSWGGTVAEAWASRDGLKAFPQFQQSIQGVDHAGEKAAVADHQRYLRQKGEWDKQHAGEDRGQVEGRAIWAGPTLDVSSWPQITEPQAEPEETLKGFDGVVWFHKEVELPGASAGKELLLRLPGAYRSDTTYFNGTKIGEGERGAKPEAYVVPGSLVKADRNVIVIRLRGGNGFVGFTGEPDNLCLVADDQAISLAGAWSYEPGPALTDLPEQSLIAKLGNDPDRSTVLFH